MCYFLQFSDGFFDCFSIHSFMDSAGRATLVWL
uniref:Uncharacterized protein n=1 Tax=Rhizophora mucronata TaxID=61149 RepID=A0A2P2NRJ5_RHIMU